MGNTPKSVFIIWILTAIAILLSIISLIGIIISRSDRLKKKVLFELQERGFYVQDFDLKIFPISDIFRLHIKGFKSDNLSFDSLDISPVKVSIRRLNLDSVSCGTCDLSFGINSSLTARNLRIEIKSKGNGKKIDITPICKIKEINRSRIAKILSHLSLTLNIYDSAIRIDDLEVVFREFLSDIYIDYIELYSEQSLMIDGFPKIQVITDTWFDLEQLGGTADIRIIEPFNTFGKVDLVFCNEKQIDINYNLSSQPNIKVISEYFGESISAEPNFIILGNFSISKESQIRNSVNIKGYAKNIVLLSEDQKIGDIEFDISTDYSGNTISFSGKVKSDHIRGALIQGEYNTESEKVDINFSGDIDLDKIPELGLHGKLSASGYLKLPKLKVESDIRFRSFAYDTIRMEQGYGKINLSPESIKFDLKIKNQKSDIDWAGEFNLKKQELISQAKFFSSPLNGLLKILNIDLPINGNSDGEISLNIFKNKLSIFGELISYRSFAFGEALQCLYANISGDADLKKGDFFVHIKGAGAERGAFCMNRNVEPYDNSLVYFEANVDSKNFLVSISGTYDLSQFDMLNLSMRGNAYFNGGVSGYITGKTRMKGEIELSSENFEITDYAVASSCINGKILISDESIGFEGKSCEGFDIYSLYSSKNHKILVSISRGETVFLIQDDDIKGKGTLEDISLIVPRLKNNTGNFEMKYKIKDKDGMVYLTSPTFALGDLKFEDLNFSGNIQDNIMLFSVSGIYSGEKFLGKGEYHISSRKVHSDFEIRSFSGIPLTGKLTVSGTIDKPYIIGDFEVNDIEITDEKIRNISKENQSVSQPESKPNTRNEEKTSAGTLNIKVKIQNVEYSAQFINLKINGLLYITGTTDNPNVLGILDIIDGNFSLADTDFSGIKGNAFVRGDKIFLNISGSTDVMTFEGEKFKVQIRIVGDIRSPKVYLSSIPSIPQSDIVCILATYRRCDSLDEFNKIIASVIYRNFSLLSRSILGNIGEATDTRIIISPTDVGFARKFGYFDIVVMQSIISDVKMFSASRSFGQNYQFIFSWDNKRYGYSVLGDIGNIGIDVKRRLRF